ncbi:hypothetical protein AYL99_02356 [Fonsecaea erecta]|uniref:F-box domain-containing protein n=1 Tax=Fonsecaea erecta TaxID=1367422 RepID=A0A178ZTM8_9EURO|nr:hypothetical protein AYL99_02356 [Fonsecaea erecta]OAP63129.1 hypothetical protein AYL99_02356 [Fonsecaea erecta]
MNLYRMAPSNLLSLEAEVLAHVLTYVDDESPRTTAAVARTCQYLHYVARLVRYRRATIHWDNGLQSWVNPFGRPQKEWETPEFLQGLRELTVCKIEPPPVVDGPPVHASPTSRELCDSFNQLESVLRNASNLKTLVWKVGYLPSEIIVETLQAHQPNARLDIFRGRRLADTDVPLESEKVLAAATCLNSLSMSTTETTRVHDHLVFHMILRSAPNLRFVSMISHPQMQPFSPAVSSLRTDLDSWFPPDQGSKRSSSLRHLTLDGWGISANTLHFWSQYADLALLTSLKVSRGPLHQSFFQHAPQILPNLKSFVINLAAGEPSMAFLVAAHGYLATCPPLVNLSVWSWRGKVPLPTILDQHGATLEDLQLHQCEKFTDLVLREPLSVEELRSIRQSCPRLRVLTFDLNRASPELTIQDYEGIFGELRKFKLDRIQIYFDSGVQWLYLTRHLSGYGRGTAKHRMGPCIPPLRSASDVWLPTGCPADSDFEGAPPFTIEKGDPGWWDPARPDNDSNVKQPPSPHRAICRFLIQAWKTIFGSHTSGPRQLELKFGEWEGRHPSFLNMRDVRLCGRARPHERDDMVGECFVELDCCGNDHHRKFSSVQTGH